jgi:hypothetical protein
LKDSIPPTEPFATRGSTAIGSIIGASTDGRCLLCNRPATSQDDHFDHLEAAHNIPREKPDDAQDYGKWSGGASNG